MTMIDLAAAMLLLFFVGRLVSAVIFYWAPRRAMLFPGKAGFWLKLMPVLPFLIGLVLLAVYLMLRGFPLPLW